MVASRAFMIRASVISCFWDLRRGGMPALRMPGLFGNLGHSNVILTAGGGSFGHIDGAAAGAASLRQAEQCWKEGADLLEFAKEHQEFARASRASRRMPISFIPTGARRFGPPARSVYSWPASRFGQALIDRRLYLPKAWARYAARRAKDHRRGSARRGLDDACTLARADCGISHNRKTPGPYGRGSRMQSAPATFQPAVSRTRCPADQPPP
jgi:hypothetical protein